MIFGKKQNKIKLTGKSLSDFRAIKYSLGLHMARGIEIKKAITQEYLKWYTGETMDLVLIYDRRGGKVSGFLWNYDKPGHEKIFCKADNKISHHFILEDTEDYIINSRLSAAVRPSPGKIDIRFISELKEEASFLKPAVLKYIIKYITVYNDCLV